MARYYDPATGQFLDVDPKVQQTLEAYLYAGDNPVSQRDPDGAAIFPHCSGTGDSAAKCDLNFMARTDFPGLSPAHIALMISSAGLAIAATVLINGLLPPGAGLIVKAGLGILGLGGAFGLAARAYDVGQPSQSQLYNDTNGALDAVYVDKYVGQPGVSDFVQTYGLGAFLGTVVVRDPEFLRFESIELKVTTESAMASIVGEFTDKAVDLATSAVRPLP